MQGEELGNAEKVAALLLSLLSSDRGLVARVLDKFEPDELELVTKAASRIGALPPARVAHNIQEFLDRWREGPSIIGNERNSRNLLEAAQQIRSDEAEPAALTPIAHRSVWERCESLPIESLSARISAEAPQIAAFWLAQLSPALSSAVLASMSVSQAAMLLGRLAQIKSPKPEATAFLESYVEEILAASAAQSDMGEEAAVQAVTMMEQDAIIALMSRLDQENPEVAARLRKNMFNFPDLATLPFQARLSIFERVTADKVILALQGAEAAIADAVLEALGTRTRRMVEQELARQEPAPKKEIQAARQEIVAVILQLLREGAISREAQAA